MREYAEETLALADELGDAMRAEVRAQPSAARTPKR